LCFLQEERGAPLRFSHNAVDVGRFLKWCVNDLTVKSSLGPEALPHMSSFAPAMIFTADCNVFGNESAIDPHTEGFRQAGEGPGLAFAEINPPAALASTLRYRHVDMAWEKTNCRREGR
jgi:hypothetical protein